MKRVLLLSAFLFSFIFAGANIKILHSPYLQNLKSDEVTVAWVTDKPSVGWLEILPDDGSDFYLQERPKFFDSQSGIKNISTVHAVRLTDLEPGTKYRYRIYAREILDHTGNEITYGQIVATNVFSKEPLRFKTADPAESKTSFAVVNDIHGSNDLLKNLIGKCDLKNTDFFIFNGDMVSIFDNQENVFAGFMDTATQLFASEIPAYYTRGNHETRGKLASAFHTYFSPESEQIYYTFRQGPVGFIVLDCGEDKPDSDIEYYDITVYDRYRSEQALWLKRVLNRDIQ